MLAAAEVNEALRAVDELSEQVGSDDVDRHDDLVPLVEQRLRGRPSEAVCGAGDEDTRYPSLNAR